MGAAVRSEWLRLALADEDSGVRSAAAAALGQSSDPAALDDLERLLGDDDPGVRAAAVRAVPALVGPDGDAVLRQRSERLLEAALADAPAVAIAAVEAFERLAAGVSLAPVARVLGHPDPEIVQSAVRCLTAHLPDDELAGLQSLIGHPHWAVRADVIHALAQRRVLATLPAVLRRLELEQDEFVRDVLLRALARLEAS
jgi:HEAT repeat protein